MAMKNRKKGLKRLLKSRLSLSERKPRKVSWREKKQFKRLLKKEDKKNFLLRKQNQPGWL